MKRTYGHGTFIFQLFYVKTIFVLKNKVHIKYKWIVRCLFHHTITRRVIVHGRAYCNIRMALNLVDFKGVLRTTSIFSIFSYRLLIWLWIWQGLSYWPPISRLDCQGCFQIWGRLEFVQPPPTNRCHPQQKQPCTRLAYKWQFGFPAEKRSKNEEIGISKRLQVNLCQIKALSSVNKFSFELHSPSTYSFFDMKLFLISRKIPNPSK